MTRLTDFSPELERRLPATHALLLESNFVVHPAVERVALEGSRGLGGHPRPDSDVDLSLVVDRGALPAQEPAREALLRPRRSTRMSSLLWARVLSGGAG